MTLVVILNIYKTNKKEITDKVNKKGGILLIVEKKTETRNPISGGP